MSLADIVDRIFNGSDLTGLSQPIDQPSDALGAIAEFQRLPTTPHGRFHGADPRSPSTVSFSGEDIDPNFLKSYIDDAMARKSLDQGQRILLKAYTQPGLTAQQRSAIQAELERRAAQPKNDNLIVKGLSYLSRPLQVLSLAVTDVFDRQHDASWADYVSVLTGDYERLRNTLGDTGLVDPKTGAPSISQAFAHGIVSPSGSSIWKWEPTSSWYNKVGRFAADFAGQVVFDPLSYVTLGASATSASAREAVASGVVREMTAETTGRIISGTTRSTASRFGEAGELFLDRTLKALPAEELKIAAREAATNPRLAEIMNLASKVDRAGKPLVTEAELIAAARVELGDELIQQAVHNAAGVAAKKATEEFVNPAVLKEFGQIPEAYQDLGKIAKLDKEGNVIKTWYGAEQKVLPPWTLGGVHIGTWGGASSWTIPGSQGIARRVTTPIRDGFNTVFPAFGEVLTRVAGKTKNTFGFRRLSSDRILSELIRSGVDAPEIVALRAAGRQEAHRMVEQIAMLDADLAIAAGKANDNLDEMLRTVTDLIESGAGRLSPDEVMLTRGQIGSTREVHDAAVNMANGFVKITDTLAERLRAFDKVRFGDIENYTPHIPTDEFTKILEAVANSSEVVGLRAAADDPFGAMFEEMVNKQRVKTQAGSAGVSAFTRERTEGKVTVNFMPDLTQVKEINADFHLIHNDLITAVGGKATGTAYGRISKMNEGLSNVVRRIAKENPGLIPAKYLKDFEPYLSKSSAVTSRYVMSMLESVHVYQALDMFSSLKMARRRGIGDGFEVKISDATSNLFVQFWDAGKKEGESLGQMVEGLLAHSVEPDRVAPVKMKKVRLGDSMIELPAAVANHPQYREVQKKLNDLFAKAKREATKWSDERRAYHSALRAQGWSKEMADAISSGMTEDIARQVRKLIRIRKQTVETFERTVEEARGNLGSSISESAHQLSIDETKRLISEIEKASDDAITEIAQRYAEIIDQGARREVPVAAADEVASVVVDEEHARKIAELMAGVSRADNMDRIAELMDLANSLRIQAADHHAAMTSMDGELTSTGLAISQYEAEIEILRAEKKLTKAERAHLNELIASRNEAAALKSELEPLAKAGHAEIESLQDYLDAVDQSLTEAKRRAVDPIYAALESHERAIEGRYAREAAVSLLGEIEDSGIYPMGKFGMEWPEQEIPLFDPKTGELIDVVKFDSQQIQAQLDELFKLIPEHGFSAEFFNHDAIREAQKAMIRRGKDVPTTAELEAIIAEQDAGSALARSFAEDSILARRGGEQVITDERNLIDFARAKDEFDQKILERGKKRGRPPEFPSQEIMPPFSSVSIWEDIARVETNKWRDKVFLNPEGIAPSPKASPFLAMMAADGPLLEAQLAHTHPVVWDYWTKRLHEAGLLPSNMELVQSVDAKGKHVLTITSNGPAPVVVPPAVPFEDVLRASQIARDPIAHMGELANKVSKPNTGFTFNPYTGRSVEFGDDLRVISIAERNQQVSLGQWEAERMPLLLQFADANRDLLGDGAFIGVWRTKDGVDIDISYATRDYAKAWEDGIKADQAAVWDAIDGETYYLPTERGRLEAKKEGKEITPMPPPTPPRLKTDPVAARERAAKMAQHPDLSSLLDSAMGVAESVAAYRNLGKTLISQTNAVTTAQKRALAAAAARVKTFDEAAAVVQEALRTSLYDKTYKGRAKLMDTLFKFERGTGKRVLTAEGRAMKKYLPADEFARLANNAEYLAVSAELEKSGAPTLVQRAARAAKAVQDRQAQLMSQSEADATLATTQREIEAMLGAEDARAREVIDVLAEVYKDVESLRRYTVNKTDEEAIAAGVGGIYWGRDDPEFLATFERIRKALKSIEGENFPTDLSAKTIRENLRKQRAGEAITAPSGKTYQTAVPSVLTGDRAAEAFNPERFALAPAEMATTGVGGRFIDLGVLGLSSGALEGASATRPAALFLANYVDVNRQLWNSTGLIDVAESFRRMQRYWKMANTVGRPFSFNIRNYVGAVMNNMLIGISPLDAMYARMWKIMPKFRSVLEREGFDAALKTVPKKYQEGIRAMWEHSSVLAGYKRTNLSHAANEVLPLSTRGGKLQAINPISPGFAPFRAGAQLMGTVEDVVRATAFMRHYMSGATADTAAALTIGVHFDYSDLTNMERSIQKYIPFWVWASRNLKLQARAMVERPEMVLRYYKLQRAVADNFGSDEPNYDAFSTSQYWGPYAAPTSVFIRKDTPYWARVFFDLDAPVKDLIDSPLAYPTSPSEWINWVSSQLGPRTEVIKLLTDPDPGYQSVAPIGLQQALMVASLLPGFNWRVGPDGKVAVNPLVGEGFDTLFPWVRNLIEPLMVPNDPARAQRLGFAPGSTSIVDRLRASLLEQAKGVGLKLQTPVDQKSGTYLMQQLADQIERDLKTRGAYNSSLESSVQGVYP